MRKVLGTHLGHSAIYTMCRIMEERYCPWFKQFKHISAALLNIYYYDGGICVSVTTCKLHQGVHGGCTIVERSCILCWNGTVGRTQTPCPQKHTYTCSAIFLQGNTHTHTEHALFPSRHMLIVIVMSVVAPSLALRI